MEDRIGDFLVGFNEATALAFEIGDLAARPGSIRSA
jgi:hypothetical protein